MQLSNQQLCNRRFDACKIVDATLVKKVYFVLSGDKHYANISTNLFWKKLLEMHFSIFYSKYGVGDGLAKQNLHFKLLTEYIDFTATTKV